MPTLLRLLGLLLFLTATAGAAEGDNIVVIAHPSVPRLDVSTLQRVYTGRAIEVAGAAVIPVNLVPGHPARDRFLSHVVGQDNGQYVAYWTVRRHIGKGVPPREFRSVADLVEFVQSTPGAIGYIASSDLRPGLNVVAQP